MDFYMFPKYNSITKNKDETKTFPLGLNEFMKHKLYRPTT